MAPFHTLHLANGNCNVFKNTGTTPIYGTAKPLRVKSLIKHMPQRPTTKKQVAKA
jgi:hypothetical protein